MPHENGIFPLIALAAVFILTAARQALGVRLGIWQIMLGGALSVLAAGSISPSDALASINLDVMIFLFGMFAVGEALVRSGYLHQVSGRVFGRARGVDALVLLILISAGALSALLMNDTLAIIGTPVVLHYAERHNVNPKLLLLTLCFAITIGSVASPIGNPQNLLIAIEGGMENPFVTFFRRLGAPTVVNLFLAYTVLKVLYKGSFTGFVCAEAGEGVRDAPLAALSKVSLVVILLMVALKVAGFFLDTGLDVRLTYIALAAAFPVIVLSARRVEIIRGMDWRTLIFFASLFVLMESVWRSGAFTSVVASSGPALSSTGVILALGVCLSQVLSNVPFVALYLPVLKQLNGSPAAMTALAAGSTIAGNLFILGAASNVIVIQAAERRGVSLGFFEFARAGVPLTILNSIVYWAFLSLMP